MAKGKPKVVSMRVIEEADYDTDLSWIGEYSMKPAEGAIDLNERYGENTRRCRYFNPAQPEYAEEDLAHMEKVNRGDIAFVMVKARAVVEIPIGNKTNVIVHLDTPSIGGIETDYQNSDEIKEYAEEEMSVLKRMITALGLKWDEKMATGSIRNM